MTIRYPCASNVAVSDLDYNYLCFAFCVESLLVGAIENGKIDHERRAACDRIFTWRDVVSRDACSTSFKLLLAPAIILL